MRLRDYDKARSHIHSPGVRPTEGKSFKRSSLALRTGSSRALPGGCQDAVSMSEAGQVWGAPARLTSRHK